MGKSNLKASIPWIGGNAKGHFTNKWNRAAKLNAMLPDLEMKLINLMGRGSERKTETYRCATAVLLMMHTGIRVGNEDSAEGYVSKRKDRLGVTLQTYGLTTLKPEHLVGTSLNFVGKREVAQVIKVPKFLQHELKLLKRIGSDTMFNISHYQLSKFVKTYVGKKFMPKDFRTVVGCRIAAQEVAQLRPWDTKKERSSQIKMVAEKVALQLGNSAAMAKRAYICPEILDI